MYILHNPWSKYLTNSWKKFGENRGTWHIVDKHVSITVTIWKLSIFRSVDSKSHEKMPSSIDENE